MKALPELKVEAVKLRKRGLSYSEIKREVPVAKSTLSLWLKTVPLREEHRKRLYTKKIAVLTRGPQSQHERRKREVTRIITEAEKEIPLPLSQAAYRLMGAALYWAEGSKRKGFEITNSDPSFVLFMVKWLETVFGVPANVLKARLNIYPQQDESKIQRFWSQLTGIPRKNFGKSFVKPISTGYKKNNLYYGTVKIEMPRGTDSRHRIFGWINAVLKDIAPKVHWVERRWISLRNTKRPANI